MTGLEPFDKITLTAVTDCDCEFCQGYRAALALHGNGSNRHLLAESDPDLDLLIGRWKSLAPNQRNAILTLIIK